MAVYIPCNDQTSTYNIRSQKTHEIIASALSTREAKRICKSRRYQVYGITCYE
mgnify:CR=1 FL=1